MCLGYATQRTWQRPGLGFQRAGGSSLANRRFIHSGMGTYVPRALWLSVPDPQLHSGRCGRAGGGCQCCYTERLYKSFKGASYRGLFTRCPASACAWGSPALPPLHDSSCRGTGQVGSRSECASCTHTRPENQAEAQPRVCTAPRWRWRRHAGCRRAAPVPPTAHPLTSWFPCQPSPCSSQSPSAPASVEACGNQQKVCRCMGRRYRALSTLGQVQMARPALHLPSTAGARSPRRSRMLPPPASAGQAGSAAQHGAAQRTLTRPVASCAAPAPATPADTPWKALSST